MKIACTSCGWGGESAAAIVDKSRLYCPKCVKPISAVASIKVDTLASHSVTQEPTTDRARIAFLEDALTAIRDDLLSGAFERDSTIDLIHVALEVSR